MIHVIPKRFYAIRIPRDFLNIHLPHSLRIRCDLTTLKLAPEQFYREKNLRAFYSDVLWSLKRVKATVISMCYRASEVRRTRIWRFGYALRLPRCSIRMLAIKRYR